MKWNRSIDGLPKSECVCLVYNESRPLQYFIAFFWPQMREFELSSLGTETLTNGLPISVTHWFEIVAPELRGSEDKLAELTRQAEELGLYEQYMGARLWRDVAEDPPEVNEHVLVYDRAIGVCRGYWCYHSSSWRHYPLGSYAGDGCLYYVSHWMPLPEKPKE